MPILLILSVFSIVTACTGSQDGFSVEVILNQPWISYDLDILRSAENVKKLQGEEILLYKSHYRDDLAVSFEEVVLWDGNLHRKEAIEKNTPFDVSLLKAGERYVSIRITPKSHEVTKYEFEKSIQTSKTTYSPHQDGKILETPEDLTIPGWKIRQSGSVRAHSPFKGDRSLIFYKAEYEKKGISVLFSTGDRENLSISIYLKTNEEIDNIPKSEVINLISSVLSLNGSEIKNIEENIFLLNEKNFTVIEPINDFTNIEGDEALETELNWLRDAGVISGLKERDIQEIKSTISPGYAGTDGRLVYAGGDWFSGGNWIPYSAANGLGHTAGCGGIGDFEFPEGDVEITKKKEGPIIGLINKIKSLIFW